MEPEKLDQGITVVRQRGDVAWLCRRLDVRSKGAGKAEAARPERGCGRCMVQIGSRGVNSLIKTSTRIT
jgi:hypothetical protein